MELLAHKPIGGLPGVTFLAIEALLAAFFFVVLISILRRVVIRDSNEGHRSQ